jgi:phospholipid/cholesterol/gamma-HCH transport system substrate-binding protein
MEPEARYTLIGTVLLALAVAAMGAFVWLSSSGNKADFEFYTVYFERQSLEGLQIGADVNMRGVKVGRVEDYTISRDNINRVAVTLRVARATPVSENTSAVVARNFVTSIARINLETPGKPGPPLSQVPEGERYPVIPEGTSDIDQITSSVTRLATQADVVLGQLSEVLGPGNQSNLAQTLAAIRGLSEALNQRVALIDQTSKTLQSSAHEFRQSSQAFTLTLQSVNGMIGPLGQEAGQTLRDARLALQSLAETGRRLETAIDGSLKGLDRDLGKLSQRTTDAADLSVLELRATAEALRSSIELISRTLDRLHDPRAALLGPSQQQLGPGEGRP